VTGGANVARAVLFAPWTFPYFAQLIMQIVAFELSSTSHSGHSKQPSVQLIVFQSDFNPQKDDSNKITGID